MRGKIGPGPRSRSICAPMALHARAISAAEISTLKEGISSDTNRSFLHWHA